MWHHQNPKLCVWGLRCSGNQSWRHLRCCPGAVPVHQGDRGPGRCDGVPQDDGLLWQALRVWRDVLHHQGPQQPPDTEVEVVQPPRGGASTETETSHTGKPSPMSTSDLRPQIMWLAGGEWGAGGERDKEVHREDKGNKPGAAESQQVETGNWDENKGFEFLAFDLFSKTET